MQASDCRFKFSTKINCLSVKTYFRTYIISYFWIIKYLPISAFFLSSLNKLPNSVANLKLCKFSCFYLSLCTSHWCWNQLMFQSVSSKTLPRKNIFLIGQLNNLVLCYRSNVHSHKKISRYFQLLSVMVLKIC